MNDPMIGAMNSSITGAMTGAMTRPTAGP